MISSSTSHKAGLRRLAMHALLPPAELPPLPAMSTRRAYLHVLGLFVVIFGTSLISNVHDGWAVVTGHSPTWMAWWPSRATSATRAGYLLAFVWLATQMPWSRLRPWRSAAVVIPLAGGLILLPVLPGHTAAPLDELLSTALTITLAAALAYRRGLTRETFGVGPTTPDDPLIRHHKAARSGWMAFYALWLGTFLAEAIMAIPGIHRPPTGFQVNGIHDVPMMIIASLNAGVLEEVVLVATVITALEAARRPVWEIYTISLTMRVLVHGYFGLAAPAALAMAWVIDFAYRRHRRLTPLILAHALFNMVLAIEIIAQHLSIPPAAGIVLSYAAALASVRVLKRRAARRVRPNPPPPDPGAALRPHPAGPATGEGDNTG